MLRNYNYILTIMLYPFILLLEFLMFKGFLKSNLYWYLILFMIIIFIPSFIMSLYHALEEIFASSKKWRVILLILFPFFYLPIYYTKYVSQQEKYLGIIICFFSVILSYFTYQAFINKMTDWLNEIYRGGVTVHDHFTYFTNDKLFSISVSSDFRCKNNDIGDYVISCDKLNDDSFIGVYRYDVTDFTEDELSEIFTFHINQTMEYIKEHGYDGVIENDEKFVRINYNDMVVLMTQKNYLIDDSEYSIVIIKEMPKELEDLGEFQKMIETIKFLNYNEEESS